MNADLDNTVSVQQNDTSSIANSVAVQNDDTRSSKRYAYYFRHPKCDVCGKEFKAARKTAIYCSSKCRQKAKRDRDEMGRRAYTAAQLVESVGRAPDSDYKRVCLVHIGHALEKALESLHEK